MRGGGRSRSPKAHAWLFSLLKHDCNERHLQGEPSKFATWCEKGSCETGGVSQGARERMKQKGGRVCVRERAREETGIKEISTDRKSPRFGGSRESRCRAGCNTIEETKGRGVEGSSTIRRVELESILRKTERGPNAPQMRASTFGLLLGRNDSVILNKSEGVSSLTWCACAITPCEIHIRRVRPATSRVSLQRSRQQLLGTEHPELRIAAALRLLLLLDPRWLSCCCVVPTDADR